MMSSHDESLRPEEFAEAAAAAIADAIAAFDNRAMIISLVYRYLVG